MKLVKFGDLEPGQKFKSTYPGANKIMMKCRTLPGTQITESTPDFLGWAVESSTGDLNEWENSYIVCAVE